MKKLIFSSFILCTLGSCTKSYTCRCSVQVGGSTVAGQTTFINSKSRSTASDQCSALSGYSTSGSYNQTCKLD